jgi:type IV pilus assembly protein PilM
MAEVTLFIEDNAVRILVASGRRVEKWGKMPLEPGLVSDGVILDEAQVAEKIKELFKLQKIGARTVIAGVIGFNSLYRVVSLPEMPDAILPEAVKQEASRVIPIPMEQIYLSYQIIPGPPGEKHIFLAAFPRNTYDALTRTMQKAGLRAVIMDLAPLALCRTVDAPKAILVDVRSSSLDIGIMLEKVPRLIRSVPLPTEAESLQERLPSIVEEFNRTITFYNSSNPKNPLGKDVPVFVSGDLAVAPDTWESIKGTSEYSFSVLSSPMQPLEGFDPSQFMINIGLALKQVSLEKEGENFSLVNFNVIPEAAPKPPKRLSPAAVLLPIIIILGSGMIYYMVNRVQNNTAYTQELTSQLPVVRRSLMEEREAIPPMQEAIAELELQFEPLDIEVAMHNDTLDSLEYSRTQDESDLSKIIGLVPEDVALIYGGDEIGDYAETLGDSKIEHGVDRVTIEGVATNEEEVFEYARALRGSGRFSKVVLLSIEACRTAIESEEEEGEEEGGVEEEFEGFNFQFLLIN